MTFKDFKKVQKYKNKKFSLMLLIMSKNLFQTKFYTICCPFILKKTYNCILIPKTKKYNHSLVYALTISL